MSSKRRFETSKAQMSGDAKKLQALNCGGPSKQLWCSFQLASPSFMPALGGAKHTGTQPNEHIAIGVAHVGNKPPAEDLVRLSPSEVEIESSVSEASTAAMLQGTNPFGCSGHKTQWHAEGSSDKAARSTPQGFRTGLKPGNSGKWIWFKGHVWSSGDL